MQTLTKGFSKSGKAEAKNWVWSCVFLPFELTMGSESGSRGSVTQSPGGNYLNLANINHYPPPPTPDIQTNCNGAVGAKNLIDNNI